MKSLNSILLVLSLIFSGFFPGIIHAQSESGVISDWISENLTPCSEQYMISGPSTIRIWETAEYRIVSKWGNSPSISGDFSLQKEGKEVEKKENLENYVHNFTDTGGVTLVVRPHAPDDCVGNLSLSASIFHEMILYVWEKHQEVIDQELVNVFESKGVLLDSIFLEGNQALADVSDAWNKLSSADIIVLSGNNILSFFSDIEKLQRLKAIDFSLKKIYVISSSSRSFLSKVLASSVAKIGADKIFLISENDFRALLARWSFWDDRHSVIGEELSYEKKDFSFSMSSFLEYLSYAWVSYQFLWILLSLAVVALALNFLKQVIGMYVFSIYYPILYAVILFQMWWTFTVAFSILVVASLFLVHIVTKKVQLLFNAKRSLLMSIYILLILLTLAIDNYLSIGIFRYTAFEYPITLIAIFTLFFIVERTIYDMELKSLRGFCLEFLQYIIVTGIAFFLLSNNMLQYFLISYPDTIFLIVIGNILVGRYMWLQVFEYFRFAPILRSMNSEEE